MIQPSNLARISVPVPSGWPAFNIDANYSYLKTISTVRDTFTIAARHSSGEICSIRCSINVGSELQKAKSVLRELKALRHLRSHRNILCTYDMDYEFDAQHQLTDVYLYTEFPRSTLASVISSKKQLSRRHIQFLFYQLLCALNYVHSAGLVHGNVQPCNILINPDTTIRLSDFTNSRTPDTVGLETRLQASIDAILYQAPEVLLGATKISYATDIWSAGCILAQLVCGSPIFDRKDLPGQIRTIISRLGTPPDDVLARIASSQTAKNLRDLQHQKALPLRHSFPDADQQEIELFRKVLNWDPLARGKATSLLESPYFTPWRSRDDEAMCPNIFSSEFEQEPRLETVNHMIMAEVYRFREIVRQETLGGFNSSRKLHGHSFAEGSMEASDEDGEFEWDPNDLAGAS